MKKIIIIFFFAAVVSSSIVLWTQKSDEQESNTDELSTIKHSTVFSSYNEVYPRDKDSLVRADWSIIAPQIIPVCKRGKLGSGDIELRDRNNKPLKEFPQPPTCDDILQSLAWCVNYYHVPNVCIEDEYYFYAWYAGEPFQGEIIDKKHFRCHGWQIVDGQLRIIGSQRAEATTDGHL